MSFSLSFSFSLIPTLAFLVHNYLNLSKKDNCAWSKTKVNTYRQQLIASDIASDVAGASLATVQFFSHTLFSLATFWRGGGEEREGKRWERRKKALAMRLKEKK